MNELIDITVTFYFRITDTACFGGEGSVGYTKLSHEHVGKPDKLYDDNLTREHLENIARLFECAPECVEMIPWQEYEKENPDSEEDDERNGELRWCRQWLIKDAADAIESLIAERDAAVNEISSCKLSKARTCKYYAACLKKYSEMGAFGRILPCPDCDNWQWRGPQEETK